MRMLREQARRTPPPQWVRVVGGFSESQFAEKRLPTLAELNAAAPDTPVFILRLYDRALLNRAALRAVGYTKDTPDPPGGRIERDKNGEPTGMLVAKPNAALLYATLAKGPKLLLEDQMNSTRHFMRELNRLGVTAVIDAGGGFQNYPQDYEVVERLRARGPADGANRLQPLSAEAEGRARGLPGLGTRREAGPWQRPVPPQWRGRDARVLRGRLRGFPRAAAGDAADHGSGSRTRRAPPGAGEMAVSLHATYDQTIGRALDVFERVNRDVPIADLHWFFDHAETISPANIDRVKALGGGIAVQHRMAYQGEDFARRYGAESAAESPPVQRILAAGVPLGAGTDATRVASYNPWVSLYWLVTGRTIGGWTMYPEGNRLDRTTALRLWTEANTWFSNEEGKKGMIKVGQLADLAVLSADYLTVAEEEIKDLASVLTLLDGRVVHAGGPYRDLSPPLPAASPDWSPVSTPRS